MVDDLMGVERKERGRYKPWRRREKRWRWRTSRPDQLRGRGGEVDCRLMCGNWKVKWRGEEAR